MIMDKVVILARVSTDKQEYQRTLEDVFAKSSKDILVFSGDG